MRTKSRTKAHEGTRLWMLDAMDKYGVTGKTMLCAGARDDCEVAFFIDRGYEAVGIDLFTSNHIIKCDMARIDQHEYLKTQRFDIVFSCHSLEHCLDIKGFARSLNLVCEKYFVCLMPFIKEPVWWDCQRPGFIDYIGADKYDEKLISYFPGFEIVANEVHKGGIRGFFILRKVKT